jgi:hypothetical protein
MQNTHFVFSNFFSPQTYRLSYSVGGKECGRYGQATDDNMVHALCVPGLQTHTQNMKNLFFHDDYGYANAPHVRT